MKQYKNMLFITILLQIVNVKSQLLNSWNFNGNYLDSVGSATCIISLYESNTLILQLAANKATKLIK